MSLAYQLLLMVALAAAAYLAGREDGGALCEGQHDKAQVHAEVEVKTEARKDIGRSSRTGAHREADRAALDALFNRLTEEARHDPPDAADGCVLPAERLRRWADANAGLTDQGAPAAQPDGAASAPAPTGIGPGARPGGQPPAGDAGLPPAGQPALPAAGVPGASPE